MSARRTRLVFVLVLAVALGACRELTAPGSAPKEGAVRLLVLDERGEPLQDREIRVTNIGFVHLSEEDEWIARTDEQGLVVTEVPPGRYSVVVWNHGEWFDRWLEPDVELPEGLTVIDPRPRLVRGTVSIPDDLDVDRFSLALDARLTLGIRDLTFASRAQLSEEGTFLYPWMDEASYVVDVSDYPTRVRLEEDFTAAPGDSLHFDWQPDEVRIRLTLGGQALPPGRYRVEARTPGAAVRTEVLADGPEVTIYCAEGFGEIVVGRGTSSVPFLGYEAPFEFSADTVRHIELGDHRIRFEFRDPQGRELYGCRVRVEEATTREARMFSADQPGFTVFLRPGQYQMYAIYQGEYESPVMIANVASDSTFTLVLEEILD
jgi:hypothetical protein